MSSRPERDELLRQRRPARIVSTAALVLATGTAASIGLWAGLAASEPEAESVSPTPQVAQPEAPRALTATWQGTWSYPATTLGHDEVLPRLFAIDHGLLVVFERNGGTTVSGEIYDPATGEATRIAPSGMEWRANAAMVWTGSELLIVGGSNGPGIEVIGAAYDPGDDSWRRLPDPPGPVDAWGNAVSGPAVWTGSEMLIPHHGLAYDPFAEQWRSISKPPGPQRAGAVTAWAGTEVVVWGGCDASEPQCDDRRVGILTDGIAYEPDTDTWREIADGPLVPEVHPRGAWTGTELIVYAGLASPQDGASFAAYDPGADTWRELSPPPLTHGRYAAVTWTGELFVLWGGSDLETDRTFGDGAVYDISSDAWSVLSPSPPDAKRDRHAMAWIDEQIYITGGVDTIGPLRFEPDVED